MSFLKELAFIKNWIIYTNINNLFKFRIIFLLPLVYINIWILWCLL